MQQGMEKQLADMKISMDERMIQAEQHVKQVEEAWQEAITRASQAEARARELEKTIAAWEEQEQVDRIHRQLWATDRSGAPVGDSNMEPPVEESAVSYIGKGDSDKRSDDYDVDMNEVNRMFDCENVLYKLISLIGNN